MLRLPAVAGRFYPDDPGELKRQVESFCSLGKLDKREADKKDLPLRAARACLVPHAGYRFSGHVAGAVYARLRLPRRILLIGPRHYPRGAAQAILSEGVWETPLGRVAIDSDLAAELKRACPSLTEDAVAHSQEHAVEVQLPFLQTLLEDFRFVPIALGTVDFDALDALGRAIAKVLAEQSEPVLIIASSDMNHYESDAISRSKDGKAIDRILALDARGLYDTVRRESISMCGVGPAVSAITAARLLGATTGHLIRYATSGDINGDREEVVGYAGVTID